MLSEWEALFAQNVEMDGSETRYTHSILFHFRKTIMETAPARLLNTPTVAFKVLLLVYHIGFNCVLLL